MNHHVTLLEDLSPPYEPILGNGLFTAGDNSVKCAAEIRK
jgi:hypothetical protein